MIKKMSVLFFAIVFFLSSVACSFDEALGKAEYPAASEAALLQLVANRLPELASDAVTDTWLVMLYQNADDEILEQDIFIDLNEAELVGSSDQVTIVSQMDRYKGAFDGDGDWTGAKRFLVTQDDDLTAIHSEEIEDLGELDSGDKYTLVDFATWAIEKYPADHYVLILSDHGAGWTGGWNDSDPVEDSQFTTNDIDLALALIMDNTGIDGFELIGFDACLMSHLEDLSAIAPYARYAVASEETEPSLGWAYAAFLGELQDHPEMNGAELAKIIVDAYVSQDVRIVDESARSEYLLDMGYDIDDITQQQIAEEMGIDATLTAIDLTQLQFIDAALNELVIDLVDIDQREVAEARSFAQSFESVFGEEDPSPFIDVLSFADLIAENLQNEKIDEDVVNLCKAVNKAIIYEKHGQDKPGASGFALFFPVSGLLQDTYEEYVNTATRFATATLWDDFLLHHYLDEKIDITSADLDLLKPQYEEEKVELPVFEQQEVTQMDELVAPGGGAISLSSITVSEDEIDLGDYAILSTEVSGSDIGYIYIYTEYYDEESDSYVTVDTDYIDAGETIEHGGVIYPDWGSEDTFELEVEWQPIVYYITDGKVDVFAGAEPVSFGRTLQDTLYRVWGTYVYTESGQERTAVMYFNGEGVMQDIYGFVNEDGSGAPREIIPAEGDEFIVEEEWLVYDEDGSEGEFEYIDGGVLTFGNRRFEMYADDSLAGDYVVGIVAENLNGQNYEEFTEISVIE